MMIARGEVQGSSVVRSGEGDGGVFVGMQEFVERGAAAGGRRTGGSRHPSRCDFLREKGGRK